MKSLYNKYVTTLFLNRKDYLEILAQPFPYLKKKISSETQAEMKITMLTLSSLAYFKSHLTYKV